MQRQPAVAGQFYPGSKEALLKELGSLVTESPEKDNAIGVVSPHAGYIYSGGVAGSVLGAIKNKDRYIIMGPNHTGMGVPFGLSPSRIWKTPLGDAAIERVKDYNIFHPGSFTAASYLKLREKDFLPLRTYQTLESDPINNITNVLGKFDEKKEGEGPVAAA